MSPIRAGLALGLLLQVCVRTEAAMVTLRIRAGTVATPVPARIHLRDADDAPVKPAGFPVWHDHFVCGPEARFDLPPGHYRVTAEKGPEWDTGTREFEVRDTPVTVEMSINRIANLAAEGWWGGETHVHRALDDAERLLAAEDLQIASFITWWNTANPWRTVPPPGKTPVRHPDGRTHLPLGGEDERDGGALLYHDLDRPLAIDQATRSHPHSVAFALEARRRGARWIEAEKPFWWDFPVWIAHGVVDTVGLAHNHLQRDGMLDNEAWGRPRDRNRHPAPNGNGTHTEALYHHLLNCGLRVPPTAGSASGVLPNPVGYNRVYVHLDGGFDPARWRDGLLAGRSFVSNGPLLRVRANGQLPGHVFQTDGPMTIRIEGRLDSRDPLGAVELVHNGEVHAATLPAEFTVPASGWFLVRVSSAVAHTHRFASTAPWYVEMAGRPMTPRPESVRTFIEWCRAGRTRQAAAEGLTPEQRGTVLEPWDRALEFWQALLPPGEPRSER